MKAFNKSIKHIQRSPYQAIAAILIMVFTFVVAGVFFLLGYGSSLALSYFESKPQLIIFFSDEKELGEINKLEKNLMETGKVAETKYVSKEDALELYKEWYQNDPLLLEMVTADILPQSLEVSASDARYLEELARIVADETGVEDVEYQADVVESLVSWTSMIRKAGIMFVSFLMIESLLIMITVISMKIAIRKDEIEILQLIGATKGYIGKPFLIEGALYGFIGSIVGWLVSIGGLFVFSPALRSLLIGVPINPFDPIFLGLFFVGMVFSGIVLGTLGSALALLRYLR